MPATYRFRVSFEEHEDVFRDIEIKSNQTFEDLHFAIQSAISFDAKKPASFFISNDNWIKGQEISMEERTDREGNATTLMSESVIRNFIADPHQKIYYQSDYEANWYFHIELIKILPSEDPGRTYPTCIKSHGDAPKQYVIAATTKAIVSPDDDFAALMGDVLPEEEEVADENSDMMEEASSGVDMDEIDGMNEEGEEENPEEGEEESQDVDMSDEDRNEY